MGLLFPHALNSEQERLRLPCLQKRTIEFNNGMLNGSRCSGDDPDCNYGEGGFFDAYGDCYYFYLIDIVVICSEETLQNRSSLLPCFGFQATCKCSVCRQMLTQRRGTAACVDFSCNVCGCALPHIHWISDGFLSV